MRFEASEKLPVFKTSECFFFLSLSRANLKGGLSFRALSSQEVSVTDLCLFHIYHSLVPVTTSAGSPFALLVWGVNTFCIRSIQVGKGNREVCVCVAEFGRLVSWVSSSRDVAFSVLFPPLFNLCKGQISDHSGLWSLHGVSVSKPPASFLADGLTGSKTDFQE